MSHRKDMNRVTALAKLVLDHRLSAVRDAAAQLARSREQLARINASADLADLPPVTAGIVDVRYQRWADIRRTELNILIARQTAAVIEARDAAGLALGRQTALEKVNERISRKR